MYGVVGGDDYYWFIGVVKVDAVFVLVVDGEYGVGQFHEWFGCKFMFFEVVFFLGVVVCCFEGSVELGCVEVFRDDRDGFYIWYDGLCVFGKLHECYVGLRVVDRLVGGEVDVGVVRVGFYVEL